MIPAWRVGCRRRSATRSEELVGGIAMTRLTQTMTLLGLVALLSATSGCMSTRAARSTVLWNYPHVTEPNLTQSPHEHYQMAASVADRDARALIEDLDLLFMTDRPTRLTRWHDR